MEVKVTDAIFGEMTYKHRWYKDITLQLFAKEWSVTLVAKAYSGKPITDEQRTSFTAFQEKEKEYADIAGNLVMEYINANCEELAATWLGVRTVSNIEELNQIVVPKTLLIKQDGTTLLLLDCPWDEHGLAVQFIPEVSIGSQDIYL